MLCSFCQQKIIMDACKQGSPQTQEPIAESIYDDVPSCLKSWTEFITVSRELVIYKHKDTGTGYSWHYRLRVLARQPTHIIDFSSLQIVKGWESALSISFANKTTFDPELSDCINISCHNDLYWLIVIFLHFDYVYLVWFLNSTN